MGHRWLRWREHYIHYFYKSRIKYILNIAATGSSPVTEKLSRNSLYQKEFIHQEKLWGLLFVIFFLENFGKSHPN